MGLRPTGKYTYIPRFPLNSSFHTPPGVPAGVFFCLNPAGTPPTRSFHTHIDNLQKIKLLSGLHTDTGTPPVALAYPIRGLPIANAVDHHRQTNPKNEPAIYPAYIAPLVFFF